MSVLADEPAQAEAKAVSAIEFECPMCFEPVKLSVELGGKKHPCPHCRRIITVPMPKIEERASWRDTGPKLPSAARRDEGPALEGAWGSTTKTGPSEEALREAGVIKEKEKPRTFVQKLAPYLIVGVPLLLLGLGGLALWSWLSSGKEKDAFDFAMNFASDDKSRTTIGAEGLAGLHAGAAVYQLHTGRPGSAALARDEILKAVALAGASRSPESDALLLDLTSVALELGGSAEEIAAETRLKWEEVPKALRAVVGGIKAPEARLKALRRVSAGLVERGQVAYVLPLAAQLHGAPGPERSEAQAVAGLELLRLGKKDEAVKAAELAEAIYKQKKDRPALRAAVIELTIALDRTPPKPAKKGGDDEEILTIGRGLALGREGKLTEARPLFEKATTVRADQVRAQIAATIAAVENKQADKSAFEPVLAECGPAAQKHPWAVLLLIDAALRAGVAVDRVEPALATLSGPLAGWGQLLLLRAKLSASRSSEPADVLEKVPDDSLAGRVARLDLSRHNTRRDNDWFKTVKSWPEPARAFGSLGVAQGMQKR
jgi:hypothetical protein